MIKRMPLFLSRVELRDDSALQTRGDPLRKGVHLSRQVLESSSPTTDLPFSPF